MKEEIRKILYTWYDTFMGDACIKIIDLLAVSFIFRIAFFFVHFILFYAIRLFTLALLFYCTFYHGDFRVFIYITPILFLIWLLSFFNFYFIYFQEGCANYIRSLIYAKLNAEISSSFVGLVKTNPEQISYELTKEAVLKGYCDLDMYNLTKEWYIQAQITSYFQLYFKITSYFNYFILLLQMIIWFYLTYFFFFPSILEYFFSSGLLTNFLRPLKGMTFVRTYATEARRVLPGCQQALATATEGAHQGKHPGLIDPAVVNPDNSSEVLYEGELTHGAGSPTNASFLLHPVIGRDKCEILSCKDKICNRPCGQITERVYIGHVTHSNQYGVFVSYNDFNNKSDKQYFVPYVPPVPNMDITGENINKDRTDNLNTKNTEARTMIHLYTKENIDHDN